MERFSRQRAENRHAFAFIKCVLSFSQASQNREEHALHGRWTSVDQSIKVFFLNGENQAVYARAHGSAPRSLLQECHLPDKLSHLAYRDQHFSPAGGGQNIQFPLPDDVSLVPRSAFGKQFLTLGQSHFGNILTESSQVRF